MRFRVGSHVLEAAVLREERRPGRPGEARPRRLTIQFEVPGRPAHDQAVELLQASREGFSQNESGLTSSGADGRCSGRWEVREGAYSVRAFGGRTTFRHIWVLDELRGGPAGDDQVRQSAGSRQRQPAG